MTTLMNALSRDLVQRAATLLHQRPTFDLFAHPQDGTVSLGAFIEDAVGDSSRQQHDTAVLRLAHAGAVPNTTVGMIAEWFLDWKLPVHD